MIKIENLSEPEEKIMSKLIQSGLFSEDYIWSFIDEARYDITHDPRVPISIELNYDNVIRAASNKAPIELLFEKDIEVNIDNIIEENISEEELDFIQNGLGKDVTPEPNYKNLEPKEFIEKLYEALSNRNYDRYELMLNDYAIMSLQKQLEIKNSIAKMANEYNERNAFENFKDEETEKDVVDHMKCYDIMEADISDLFYELHNDKEECI